MESRLEKIFSMGINFVFVHVSLEMTFHFNSCSMQKSLLCQFGHRCLALVHCRKLPTFGNLIRIEDKRVASELISIMPKFPHNGVSILLFCT